MEPVQNSPMPAAAIIGTLIVDDTKVEAKEYFSQLDGCTYVFKNGHVARFEGATYVTDKKGEIEELESLCRQPGQHMISKSPQEVRRSDARIMKEVGATGVGHMNSGALAGLAQFSNAKR